MSENNNNIFKSQKVPVYVIAIIIIATLPALFTPLILSLSKNPLAELQKILVWLWPFYLIVAAFLSWQCYKYQRSIMAWILIVMMYLTDVAFFYLLNI